MAKKMKETKESRKEFDVKYRGGNKVAQGVDVAGALSEPITCGEIEEIKKSAQIKNGGKE